MPRREILERDGFKSVWSGRASDVARLHVTHINHTKDERYQLPSNGRTLTISEHYIDHYQREGRNGLTVAENRGGMRLLWESMNRSEQQEVLKRSIPVPEP